MILINEMMNVDIKYFKYIPYQKIKPYMGVWVACGSISVNVSLLHYSSFLIQYSM